MQPSGRSSETPFESDARGHPSLTYQTQRLTSPGAAGGGPPYVKPISRRTGVAVGTLVDKVTRYCRYRESPSIRAPDPLSVDQADHVASGVEVLPRRTLTRRPVPLGTSAR